MLACYFISRAVPRSSAACMSMLLCIPGKRSRCDLGIAHVRGRVKLAGLRHTLTEGQVAALARAAHGFVGADIAALCSEAAMTALRRCVAADGAQETLFPFLELNFYHERCMS